MNWNSLSGKGETEPDEELPIESVLSGCPDVLLSDKLRQNGCDTLIWPKQSIIAFDRHLTVRAVHDYNLDSQSLVNGKGSLADYGQLYGPKKSAPSSKVST